MIGTLRQGGWPPLGAMGGAERSLGLRELCRLGRSAPFGQLGPPPAPHGQPCVRRRRSFRLPSASVALWSADHLFDPRSSQNLRSESIALRAGKQIYRARSAPM